MNIDSIRRLISTCADINSRDKDGNTMLMIAAKEGNLDLLKYLLDNGANMEIINNEYESALVISIYNGRLEILDELLSRGAKLNKPIIYISDDDYNAQIHITYPLIIAAGIQGYLGLNMVKLLLKYQAELDVHDSIDETALCKAISLQEDDEIAFKFVVELLKAGANINTVSYEKKTPLYMAKNFYDDKNLYKLLCRYNLIPILHQRLEQTKNQGATRDLYSLIEHTLHGL